MKEIETTFLQISATRPNSVDHLAEEVPSEFYKPGFTTIEMSIELLKKAASLYERQKVSKTFLSMFELN